MIAVNYSWLIFFSLFAFVCSLSWDEGGSCWTHSSSSSSSRLSISISHVQACINFDIYRFLLTLVVWKIANVWKLSHGDSAVCARLKQKKKVDSQVMISCFDLYDRVRERARAPQYDGSKSACSWIILGSCKLLLLLVIMCDIYRNEFWFMTRLSINCVCALLSSYHHLSKLIFYFTFFFIFRPVFASAALCEMKKKHISVRRWKSFILFKQSLSNDFACSTSIFPMQTGKAESFGGISLSSF